MGLEIKNVTNWPNLIDERLAEIDQIMDEKQAALKQAPAGELRINVRNRRKPGLQKSRDENDEDPEVTFYLVTAASGPNGTYMRKNQGELARQLAQKKYDRKVIQAFKTESKVLKQYKAALPVTSGEEVYDSFNDQWKSLITPIRLSDEEYARRWQAEAYDQFQYEGKNRVIKTNRGEMVRSKSEKIIADLLDQYHIPYRYEEVITFKDGHMLCPDFKALNVRTRKAMYWEHFGMMSDPKYFARALKKRKAYFANGYYEGENIIYTFEVENEPLSIDDLEMFVKHYFL